VKKAILIIKTGMCIWAFVLSGCYERFNNNNQKNQENEIVPMSQNVGMFRANLQRTGVYDTKRIHELSGVKWSYKTKNTLQKSPAVYDGVVYFGGNRDSLYAFDAKTGQKNGSMIQDTG